MNDALASTTRFVIEPSGNVGIGTTSPYTKLGVSGEVVAASSPATTSTASTFPYASTTALTVSGTNGLTLLSTLNGPLQVNSGVVSATSSIGVLYGGTGLTTAPAYGNLLVGTATGGYSLTATSSLGIALSDTTGTLAVARGGTNATSQTTNGVNFFNGTSITSGTALTFDGTNLGIGTTTPSRLLHVTNTGVTNQLLLEDSGGAVNQHYITLGNSRGRFSINSMNDALASTTRFVIEPSGNVGIGTTSPYTKLGVSGEVVAASFTATTSTASTFPYPSTTALTVSGTNGLTLLSTLNGPLQVNSGVVSATSSIGVLYGGTGLTTAPAY